MQIGEAFSHDLHLIAIANANPPLGWNGGGGSDLDLPA